MAALAGDLAAYKVQVINRGNVHLMNVDLKTMTNSSVTYMNTSFPMDCGARGSLPLTVNVGDSITCMRNIDFTTPVSVLGSLCTCTHFPACAVTARLYAA